MGSFIQTENGGTMKYENSIDNELSTTVDQWREALNTASQDDPGDTMREISEKVGLGLTQTKVLIKKLIAERKCKPGMSYKHDSRGYKQRIPVYQLVEKS